MTGIQLFSRLSLIPLLAAALAACSEAPLAERDPHGYEACSLFSESQSAVGTSEKVDKSLQAGRTAHKASTKRIRDAVTALFDDEAMEALEGTSGAGENFYTVDDEKLVSACEAEGFSMD